MAVVERIAPILDVLGAIETKELLEAGGLVVELGRISRWRKSGKLPPPYAPLRCSPVWVRQDIERFRDGATDGFTEPPEEPLLLGTHEVALLLSVDKSQVSRWRRKPTASGLLLPAPVTYIKAGPLYSRWDVLDFDHNRR